MNLLISSSMSGSPWGGSECLWAALAESALRRGHAVVFEGFRWPETPAPIAELRRLGLRYVTRPRRRSLLDRALSRAGVPHPRHRARTRLARWADVVLFSFGGTFDVASDPGVATLARGCRAAARPYVTVCQWNDDLAAVPAECRDAGREFFAHGAATLFVATRNWESCERQLAARVPRAGLVGNPVNLRDVSAVPLARRADAPALAVVARLEARAKGHDLLIAALARPEVRGLPWTLNVYGEGPDRDYLRDLARLHGLAERVCFHGHRGDVRGIWADNEILVLPSRSEGTPLSLVEAMLCGRPAVATDVGGNAEYVRPGVSGYLAAGPTIPLLADALARALGERSGWPALGAAARELALARHTAAPGEALLEIVAAIAAHAPPPIRWLRQDPNPVETAHAAG